MQRGPLPLTIPKYEFKFGEKSYYLLKRISVNSITDEERDVYKRYYNADTILKKEGYYHFCSEIEDAKVIWEEKILGDEVFRVNHLPDEVYNKPSKRIGRQVRKMMNKHRR